MKKLFEHAYDFMWIIEELNEMARILEGNLLTAKPISAYACNDILVAALYDQNNFCFEQWELMDRITHALGEVARNIKSVFYERIVRLRSSFRTIRFIVDKLTDWGGADQRFADEIAKQEKDYKRFFPKKELKAFVNEFIECYDLLMAEIDLMPECSKTGIWANKKPPKYPELEEASLSKTFYPTNDMTCDEATQKSRAFAENKLELQFPGYKDKADRLAAHFDVLIECLNSNLFGHIPPEGNGVGEVPLGEGMRKDLELLLKNRFIVHYAAYTDMDHFFNYNDFGKSVKLVSGETSIFKAKWGMIKKLYLFLTTGATLARSIGSGAATSLARAMALLDQNNCWFNVEYCSDHRAKLQEFMETLQDAQLQLRRDLDAARSAAEPPVQVEVIDKSVRKLADATGKSVKKAIKPGKGSANERYAHKDELMRIWKKYRKDETLRGSINHKVYHRDVFNYDPAKREIAALRSDPPITLEEFEHALGAYSDRKSRQSPAKRNKPR